MKNLTDLNFITNIDDLTQQVQNSFPSIFTKDDVLKLLDALKLNDAYFIEDESKEICGERLAILELIDNMKSDVEDCIAAYEPDLENSNEVTIESHEVDMQPLNNDVKDLVDSFREEFVKLILE